MNLLIDTHILIWYIAGNPNLKPAMTDLLETNANDLSISVASLWEITIKVGKGKLDLDIEFHDLEGILEQLNIQILPILFSGHCPFTILTHSIGLLSPKQLTRI